MGTEAQRWLVISQPNQASLLNVIVPIRGQNKLIFSFKDKNNHSFIGWLFYV